MRENIGIGYLVESIDTESSNIEIMEPLVALYIPKDAKKLNHLNRAPGIGDVIETKEGSEYLLIDVIHRDDSEEAQDVLPHILKIVFKKEELNDFTIEVVGDNESTFDHLIDEYMKNSVK